MRFPVSRLLRRPHRPERHIGYFALLEALTKPGCAICRRQAEGARKALEALFYESVNDTRTRERLRRSGGFCKEHARLAAALGDPLGLSIIYRDLIAWYRVAEGPDSVAPCLVCEACKVTERIALEVCSAHWDDAILQERLEHADLLCRHHLERLLAIVPKGSRREHLRCWAQDRLRALEDDMDAFVQHARNGSSESVAKREADAWKSAMAFFAGGGALEVEG
ncbi:MAG: hypothetical protein ONB17_08370 [candidate division KSB1 bacterium]|nr:hypothetical protein [candidate division KSB1 bacterium]MDZ7295756.1 hypothetical protein [candidate division KSB1 bacterium]MDZ7392542.1 hypothetical protein [candidate division KSB1 bacterium]MDZ7414036.1 hypothetical protein [candidate division KSB1 bacterium]